MKTKNLLLVTALIYALNAFSQNSTLELAFTSSCILDSILIENLTRGGDTTLYSPDTLLVLDFVTSIDDNAITEQNSLSVAQNYPNPFKEQTVINIYMPEREHIKITVLDILGRELAQYENTLNQGNHSFIFYSGKERYYLFSVTGKNTGKSIKMSHIISNSKQTGQCKIVYTGYDENCSNHKFKSAMSDFVYEPGDQLRYVGYAQKLGVPGSDIIENTPLTDEIYVFEIKKGIPCTGAITVTYEGKVYNTVQIGSQCWLKENLNVGTMIDGSLEQTDNSIIEKYCYSNDPVNCDAYGGLYQWDEMMQYTTMQGVQGICPSGWHVPDDEEWKQLEGEVDSQYDYPDSEWDENSWRGFDAGLNLKSSTTHWYSMGIGDDLYGFKALPGGDRSAGGSFLDIQKIAFFRTSGDSEAHPWYRSLGYAGILINRVNLGDNNGFSVRCIKD